MVNRLAQNHNCVFAPKGRSGEEPFPHATIAATSTTSSWLRRSFSQGNTLLLRQVQRISKHGLRTGRIQQGHFEQHID
jgi:hypothetical protein